MKADEEKFYWLEFIDFQADAGQRDEVLLDTIGGGARFDGYFLWQSMSGVDALGGYSEF